MAAATPTALASSTSSPATAGAFQDSLGNLIGNGYLTFDLNQAAAVSGGGEVGQRRVVITLDSNAKVSQGQSIFRNTDLLPLGTTYRMRLWDVNSNLVGDFGDVSIQGSSPIDLSIITPNTSGGSVIGMFSPQKQVFTSSGTFTIPTGVTVVKFTVVGAGGGGGGGSTGGGAGSGAGSGGAAIKWLTGLTPANTITVTIGSGGTGNSNASGNSGGASSISSGTQSISTVTANGGNPGNTGGNVSGSGGTSSGGDIGSMTGNAGFNVIVSGVGGNSGGSIFGGGVIGGVGAANGVAGAAPGAGGSGGGGGSGNTSGGTGSAGVVIAEWIA